MSVRARDLTTLVEVTQADVWKAGRRAARLQRADGGTVFTYLDDYLADPGPAVATTLPLTDRPVVHPSGAVPPFFAGLLPEGRRLSSLRRAVKTSADDDLSLLLAVGADTVGDVQVLPSGDEPRRVAALVEVHRRWDEVSFTEVLAQAGVQDPVALAGVQDKASARMLSVPVAREGFRYILKIDPPEYPNLVRNEDYFLSLARRARFAVVDAQVVLDRDERPGLLVRRFDRTLGEAGEPLSLAVEDASQLLGLYPAQKYTPTSEDVVLALASVCASQALARREVYRQFVFAWLTGNGDLHAKNISVVATPSGEYRVTPAYDLPCTRPYGDSTLALRIGGRRDGLSRTRLLAFADRIGLPEAAAVSTLDAVIEATRPVIDEWGAGGQGPLQSDAARDVVRLVRHRRRLALQPSR